MTGKDYKFYAYGFFPVLIVGTLVLGIILNMGFDYFCSMLGLFGLFELVFLPIAIGESKKKANKEQDDSTFNQYISNLGYREAEKNSYRLKMTGRFGDQPVNIRIDESNFALVDDGLRGGVPDRFYFYSVGNGDNYLLVHDSLSDEHRLFMK